MVSISFIVSRLLSADQIEERKNQLKVWVPLFFFFAIAFHEMCPLLSLYSFFLSPKKNDTSFEYLNHPASIVLVRWYRVVLDEAPAAFESYQCSSTLFVTSKATKNEWVASLVVLFRYHLENPLGLSVDCFLCAFRVRRSSHKRKRISSKRTTKDNEAPLLLFACCA